jgi:serine/threonine protein phosphatase PrpC
MGEKDSYFCGVFDGHGPYGHKVARYVRDTLPSILSSATKQTYRNTKKDEDSGFSSTWKPTIVKSFKDMDNDLHEKPTIDSYCSGTTTVAVVKHGNNLMIINMGDSRAILCTRGDRDELVPIQLTVDLKPGVPSERERIEKCGGRVLALAEEPNILRIWLPDQDSPGLAMARAFGDFCLKDHGLISIPDITHRKLCDKDEFVVLATDGIWDVLSNNEVIKIVASVRKRSMAARMLVERAVEAWRYRYPKAKIDDCAVVCLFFKKHGSKPLTEMAGPALPNSTPPNKISTEDGLETVLNCDLKSEVDGMAGGSNSSTKFHPRSDGMKRRRQFV